MFKYRTVITSIAVCTTLLIPSAFAGSHKGGERGDYKEHYKKRHQMNMDMMQMLSETMTILHDLDNKPSDKQKARLSDMIKQMEMMMKDHKEMGQKFDKKNYMKKHHGKMMDDNS